MKSSVVFLYLIENHAPLQQIWYAVIFTALQSYPNQIIVSYQLWIFKCTGWLFTPIFVNFVKYFVTPNSNLKDIDLLFTLFVHCNIYNVINPFSMLIVFKRWHTIIFHLTNLFFACFVLNGFLNCLSIYRTIPDKVSALSTTSMKTRSK